ncbi:SusC/RagA family TonB-linked outer membrane protein [Hufsiella ginkgonis]|uniref:SusC/RagA family TonB-linked outer membrane protein n=1 Tax=Hufsiella ginkgonis TaxID=2695274 RepID=A0A7K1XZN4_9SPHI|nr:SusC/RagA family TonB-linked outer membrane protein [Hufsiella ginkgonis]MXV16474.1 SusC/RagA family TonB-linked outer membrane protein [Hufsiella ginkgonis]
MRRSFTHFCKVLFQIAFNFGHFEVWKASLLNRRPSRHSFAKFLPVVAALVLAPPMVSQLQAQQAALITVRGTVIDAADSSPLPGVSIVDAQRKGFGVTDANGVFTIQVPKGTLVQFLFLGYNVYTATYTGSQDKLVIRLQPGTSMMNEVVVTALGIKREQKSLGYATSIVDSTALTNAVAANWTDALSGKVAGLNLVRNSGPDGSNKIILRGENNLTGDNEALIVIDGVVASASNSRSASPSGGVYGTSGDNLPVDYGSAINDINPEDIESVTVLKGPGAAALYGQRGANGAILITTKSGNLKRKKLNINFTSNTTFEEVNRKPDLQSEYGQGLLGAAYYSRSASADGPGTNGTSSAWGPRFDGQYYFQYDPVTQGTATVRTPWEYKGNPIDTFFGTGKESNNSVSLDGTIKTTSLRLALNHTDNEWIAPNTGYDRTSVALSVNSKITKKLTLTAKGTYNNKNSDNLPATGFGNQGYMYWVYFSQPNIDPNYYKDYWVHGSENRAFINITTTTLESPWAISYEYLNPQRRNGFVGNLQLSYQLAKGLTAQVRATLDLNRDITEQIRPYDAAGSKFAQGSYRIQNARKYEKNADALIRYEKKVSRDIGVNVTAGGSILRNEYNKAESRADGLRVPRIWDLSNNLNPVISIPDTSRYRFNSVYGLISASYKDYLFVDVTGRQDWSSVLASPYRTAAVGFFYPSVNMAFIPSDLWDLPASFDLVKLRASYSQVGSGSTTSYLTSYNYVPANNGLYPINSTTNPAVLPALNLKPLITTTLEIGTDIRMFKSRLSVDVALYHGKTRNQILTRVVDRSSGYASSIINAGRIDNEGLEIGMNGTVLQSNKGGFKWTSFATFTANRNEIKELLDSSVVLRNSPIGNAQVIANVGGSMGDMYGVGFARTKEGQIIYKADGTPLTAANPVYLGNSIPKFKTSWGNTFNYKGFSLTALFDAQFGAVGNAFSLARIAENGKSALTLPGRYNGIIGVGVTENLDASGKGTGTYRTNDIIATNLNAYYKAVYYDNSEGAMFSTDFVKFREANLTYMLPAPFVKKMGLNKVTVGGFGRNLYIWSPWPVFDPEFGSLAGTDIVTGFEVGQLPSTRTFGFRITVGL